MAFVLALPVLSVVVTACVADEPDDGGVTSEKSALKRGTTTGAGVTNGGGCKITAGSNAGKTGTYDTTTDTGHTWCCTGSGGAGDCTECSSSGGGSCQATRTAGSADRVGGDYSRSP